MSNICDTILAQQIDTLIPAEKKTFWVADCLEYDHIVTHFARSIGDFLFVCYIQFYCTSNKLRFNIRRGNKCHEILLHAACTHEVSGHQALGCTSKWALNNAFHPRCTTIKQ